MRDYESEQRKKSYKDIAMIIVYGFLIFICLLLGFGIIKVF